MATAAQHRAARRSPLAPGHWSRKGRVGGRRGPVWSQKRAGLVQKGWRKSAKRAWFWSVPRVRRTGPNMVSRNGRAEEAGPPQSGQAACQGLQGALLCGKVPPAVLDSVPDICSQQPSLIAPLVPPQAFNLATYSCPQRNLRPCL